MKKIYVYLPGEKRLIEEKVWGEGLLRYLYLERTDSRLLLFFAKSRALSRLCGWYYRMPWTRRKVAHFVQKFDIVIADFENKKYRHFNDFFTRRLHPRARPIASSSLVSPADGRLLAFETFPEQGIWIKGCTFSQDAFFAKKSALYSRFKDGPMIIIRLAPPDYHRFHAPLSGIITQVAKVRGSLFSVNPLALATKPAYLCANYRIHIVIEGKICVCMTLVGATNVGSIAFTGKVGDTVLCGDDLGCFNLGGSMIVLSITEGKPDTELVTRSLSGIETLVRVGTPLII
ncbi:MAG: hypothetical protein A3F09_04640 [Chlamydiae bacterium RIFCSPHIGHO2_12_FULL_49_11]|nr:MAG: hypothetical protein A3F09_04640 [Chlamydiae bacterium RIFCSPHIGHO2_12_FULL_49_11]